MTVPTITLNDGVQIPQLGFGVWQVPADEAAKAVTEAFKVGYRHIDTAAIYGNEEGVGEAIRDSGLDRSEIFITTKLWNDAHLKDDARKAIEGSLERLGLDYVDLYLIHWPAVRKFGEAYIEAWDSMQQFKSEGLVRSIGVSNFNAEHLDKLQGDRPSVDQIELHPSFNQPELRELLHSRGIAPEAWSPLGNQHDPSDLSLEPVTVAAQAHGKSPAQVIIRWQLQIGNIVIPKSVTPSRIAENFDVFDFELTDDEVNAITACDKGNRQGGDPATAEF